MKRSLPTLQAARTGRRGQSSVRTGWRDADRAATLERVELERPVIAVAHVDQSEVATRLAAQLCAAFKQEGVGVSALISVDAPAHAAEAQRAQAAMLEAGARNTVLVQKPERDARAALSQALSKLPADAWVVALGNALPQLFHPYFTVVVTGHRRSLTQATPLVLRAELEVASPGDELATLLARRLHTLWSERVATSAAPA